MTYPFIPGATATLAATATTGSVALGGQPRGGAFQVRVVNVGPNTAFIKRGGASVTAATTDFPVPAGVVEVLTFNNTDKDPVTHVAAICASSQTATLYFTTGEGI